MKLSFTPDDLSKLTSDLKFENTRTFFKSIAQGKVNLDEVLTATKSKEEKREAAPVPHSNLKILQILQGEISAGYLLKAKKQKSCIPMQNAATRFPGDPVIGYITIGEGIKVHRKTCPNLIRISENDPSKLIPGQWPEGEGNLFVAGLRLWEKIRPGLLNEISHAIVAYQNTNIKSININTTRFHI